MHAAVRGSRKRLTVVAIATTTAIAGCVSAPSPVIIYVTPPPTPIIIYVTPPPTPTLTPTPEPTPSPTDTPTPSPSPTPTPAPTSRAAACTGAAANKAFFAEAAAKLHFGVYCAVLPKGWYLSAGNYKLTEGGALDATYKKGGATLNLLEGTWCTGGAAGCWGWWPVIATVRFAGLSGQLFQGGTSSTWAVTANLGSAPAYEMAVYGVSKSQAVAFAAAMRGVPRS